MNKLFRMLQESFGSAPRRNGFDLSRRDIFTMKVGMKVPCFCLETVPNDYHEIRPVDVIRTFPMEQANFVRIKQHIDFYYVPMTAIQTNFHEVVQQTTDPVNALLVNSVGRDVKFFPLFRLDVILCALFYTHYCVVANDYSDSLFDVLHRVFAQAGDDIYEALETDANRQLAENMFLMFVDQLPEDRRCATDLFVNPIYQGAVRLLDMLGYGNYLDLIAPTVIEDYSFGGDRYDYVSNAVRIIENSLGKSINLSRLAAYQCVYQNFGINTVYDKLDVYSFNFDDVVYSGGNWLKRVTDLGTYDAYSRVYCVFQLRYSQWKKDIFTSAYPDSQFGGVSVVSVNYSVGESIGSVAAADRKILGLKGTDLIASNSTGAVAASQAYSSFNVLDLRRAEALQGWKEDMMRSGFRAKQRQKSQFGVAPSHDPHCMPYILGSVSSDIRKDVVTGTAGEQFAELAATGVSTLGNSEVKFDGSGRNDFGVIIGIMSIIPEADYDSYGVDLHNMKSEPFDFYTPAFQNIGLQALDSFYLNMQSNYGIDFPRIFGYVPRYAEYKQAFDKVHGEFCAKKGGVVIRSTAGSLRQYVSTRLDMEYRGLSGLASLYVNPNSVDDIFVVSADDKQKTDQFMVNMYCEVKSVRPMSVLGLPRF